MSKQDPLLDRFLLRGTVDAVEDLTPRMRRIRLTGEELRDLDWAPGQHSGCGSETSPSVVSATSCARTRSGTTTRRPAGPVRSRPPGPGPRCALGQSVDCRAACRPHQAPKDGSSPGTSALSPVRRRRDRSVAFGPMLRALPAAVPGTGHRGARARGPHVACPVRRADLGQPLLRPLTALDLPAEPGIAYIAGEARACQAARQHLTRDRGWPRRATIVKPFWAPGKRGMD